MSLGHPKPRDNCVSIPYPIWDKIVLSDHEIKVLCDETSGVLALEFLKLLLLLLLLLGCVCVCVM